MANAAGTVPNFVPTGNTDLLRSIARCTNRCTICADWEQKLVHNPVHNECRLGRLYPDLCASTALYPIENA
jgi:hypothetical protein